MNFTNRHHGPNPLPADVQEDLEARKAAHALEVQRQIKANADEARTRAQAKPLPTVEERRTERAEREQQIADRIATLGHADW